MAGLGTPAPAAPQDGADEDVNTSPAGMLDESAMQMEEPTPEEQAQFERFEKVMMGLVYQGEEVSPAVVDNLRGNFDPSALEMFAEAQPPVTDSPQDSLAATGVLLTLLTEQNGEEDFADDVVLHGGKRAIEELIEVAEAAKVHDFTEQDIETVTYRAFDLYRIASPRVNREALTAEFQQLAAASNEGRLGEVLPGLPGGAPIGKGAS